jgi:adenylate cyclase
VARLAALYGVYRERIAEWRANPPPADWDGTFTATSK